MSATTSSPGGYGFSFVFSCTATSNCGAPYGRLAAQFVPQRQGHRAGRLASRPKPLRRCRDRVRGALATLAVALRERARDPPGVLRLRIRSVVDGLDHGGDRVVRGAHDGPEAVPLVVEVSAAANVTPAEHAVGVELEVHQRPVDVGRVERHRAVVGDDHAGAGEQRLHALVVEPELLDVWCEVEQRQSALQARVHQQRDLQPGPLGELAQPGGVAATRPTARRSRSERNFSASTQRAALSVGLCTISHCRQVGATRIRSRRSGGYAPPRRGPCRSAAGRSAAPRGSCTGTACGRRRSTRAPAACS